MRTFCIIKGGVCTGTSSKDKNACGKTGVAMNKGGYLAVSRSPWPRFGALVGGIARAPSAAGSCEGGLRMRGGSSGEGCEIL